MTGETEASLLGSTPEKSEYFIHSPAFSFCLQGEDEKWEFPPNNVVLCGGRGGGGSGEVLCWEDVTYFPAGFDVATK